MKGKGGGGDYQVRSRKKTQIRMGIILPLRRALPPNADRSGERLIASKDRATSSSDSPPSAAPYLDPGTASPPLANTSSVSVSDTSLLASSSSSSSESVDASEPLSSSPSHSR